MTNTLLILENLRSAYNVGSAFRTADAASVSAIYLTGYTPYPPHTKLAKTALGATFFVPWEQFDTTQKAIAKAKKQGYTIYGAEEGVDESTNYKMVKYPEKSAFVFGNEVEGLTKQTLEICDKIVHIPMLGKKNSLNVATAIGVILYNLVD